MPATWTALCVLAFSFDTISQATLFALAAGRFGGVPEALLVAGLFVLGMPVVLTAFTVGMVAARRSVLAPAAR